MDKKHKAYIYADKVLKGKVNAPKYVKLQCQVFIDIADGKNEKYIINSDKVKLIVELLKLMIMPHGMNIGKTIYEATIGYQWLNYISLLCTVHRNNVKKRRYEIGVLEICRKNFKTFTVAIIVILLLLTEPKYSKFFSVAPDKTLSKEIQDAMNEILASSPLLTERFKRLRDIITCKLTDSTYKPLAFSNDKLDGKKPTVFVADEVGALPTTYPVEAMKSGQMGLFNKLGCIISTKYPKQNNPFEEYVGYAKKVLDGLIEDDTIFALLYEPDNTTDWSTDIGILQQSNPASYEVDGIMDDILKKRAFAIETESARENFITKHCNIIYQGVGTESYIDVKYVKECRVDSIDWQGMEVYLGVDLAMTTDNCSVAMVGYRDSKVYCKTMAFIPEDRIEEKSKLERVNYNDFIRNGWCVACGDRTVDYAVIEDYVSNIEKQYGVKVLDIGFDRYNALSSAQKWDKTYNTTEIKQHSSVLHPPTKLLEELILEKRFAYVEDTLLEINFENARCVYDNNMNRYVNKKKSNGKIDIVVGIINALYLLQQNVFLDDGGFVVQTY